MANSIISNILRILTPEVVAKLASKSGLDRSVTQTAINAAVSWILSALTGLVAKPGGAPQLANVLAQQPTDIPVNLTSNLTGAATTDKGANLLSSLLGGTALGVLTSTLSKFLGIAEGPIRTLMGSLTPIIMGVLGREQRAASLDANGLAHMLIGQSNEMAAAMPAGLSQLLEARSRSISRSGAVGQYRQAPRDAQAGVCGLQGM
jgi:hypothetical protein